eukprot:8166168-Pyramimonas_sp.AAC.1
MRNSATTRSEEGTNGGLGSGVNVEEPPRCVPSTFVALACVLPLLAQFARWPPRQNLAVGPRENACGWRPCKLRRPAK